MLRPIELDTAAEQGESMETPQGEPCPACGNSAFRPLFSAKDTLYHATSSEFHMVECAGCRLIRLHPQPTPEELREYYPDDYWLEPDRPQSGGTAETVENVYRHVASLDLIYGVERALDESGSTDSGSKGLVLDVGPRGGLRLSLLASRCANPLAGLDFTVDAAKITFSKRRVPVVCGTLSRAPFAAGSCAVVTMMHVLEHLYDPVRYLNSAHELLMPDGRLLLQIYNASSWQFLLFGERWAGLNAPRHLIHFRRQDVELLLNECGFEVLREKHFSWRDSSGVCASSLAPWLDPAARRLRHVPESPAQKAWKTIAYVLLCGACVPFTLLEAICHAGASIVFEARKKTT